MSNQVSTNLRALAPGVILALLSILLGFVLGGTFGAAEDAVKTQLRSSADSVFETVYHGDERARDAIIGSARVRHPAGPLGPPGDLAEDLGRGLWHRRTSLLDILACRGIHRTGRR
jgi:hypothetical protein